MMIDKEKISNLLKLKLSDLYTCSFESCKNLGDYSLKNDRIFYLCENHINRYHYELNVFGSCPLQTKRKFSFINKTFN